LDPEELQASFLRWIPAVSDPTAGEVITLDGKTLRRSFDQAGGKGAVTMVSTWATAQQLV